LSVSYGSYSVDARLSVRLHYVN